ncbi:hypothetical protein [Microcoleus sp. FACHB-672]|uniref:hypothetical protein n=1 Tax=Microcoleus sp. FACHB-672 TaxID=2692825 RepID=UPI00168A333B|nr:hypothetical protein [Microcoleus sp. FACHB-672]MBD2040411.1 hypothetical protein [Microcoleus sp. FACHB-672]
MTALFINQIEGLTNPETEAGEGDEAKTLDQSMTMTRICPCCSNTLVRQIRSAGLYWFCSYCHEEMPA